MPATGRFVAAVHHFPLRIYFEDTDLSGLVYHANYLRYMERARSDMLRAAGIDQRAAHDNGTGVYAVTDLTIRYRRPARLDDVDTIMRFIQELADYEKEPDAVVAAIRAIAPGFAGINIEDISAPRCFEILCVIAKTKGTKGARVKVIFTTTITMLNEQFPISRRGPKIFRFIIDAGGSHFAGSIHAV